MRRLMNSILSVCIALLSAAAGSALGQSAIVPEPAKTANAIDKLSNGIEHAYKTTPCVVDDEEDRDLYIKVKQIAEAMVKLNGDKIYLELKARAYIDNPTPPEQGIGIPGKILINTLHLSHKIFLIYSTSCKRTAPTSFVLRICSHMPSSSPC